MLGFIEAGPSLAGLRVLDFPILGDDGWLASQSRTSFAIALGIGDNEVRQRLASAYTSAGFQLRTVIHPNAVVSRWATVGEGASILAGAIVNPGASIGRGAIINTGAVVEHDAVVGDFAHVAPHSTLAGGAALGALSLLGTGASVKPSTKIGLRCIIGAGATVTEDIPDAVVAMGVPARISRSTAARAKS